MRPQRPLRGAGRGGPDLDPAEGGPQWRLRGRRRVRELGQQVQRGLGREGLLGGALGADLRDGGGDVGLERDELAGQLEHGGGLVHAGRGVAFGLRVPIRTRCGLVGLLPGLTGRLRGLLTGVHGVARVRGGAGVGRSVARRSLIGLATRVRRIRRIPGPHPRGHGSPQPGVTTAGFTLGRGRRRLAGPRRSLRVPRTLGTVVRHGVLDVLCGRCILGALGPAGRHGVLDVPGRR